jgi:hypothetical protein
MTDLAGWIPQGGAVGLMLGAFWLVFTGKLVSWRIHNEVRTDRDTYRRAAETALAASAEMSAHVGRLVGAVEQLTASQRETLDLVRRLVPAAPGERTAA